jgi:transcriptional regulator with XRE-family HTH domain
LNHAVVVFLACAYLVGTGGEPGITYLATRQDQGYGFSGLNNISIPSSSLAQLNIRSTSETLDRIRNVFKFSVSDLACACKVSRQAVYKWMSGSSPTLEPDNQNRLEDLYCAAETFAARGVVGSAMILKRRDTSGKTLVETLQAGESAQLWAKGMLEVLSMEVQQRSALDARLRKRERSTPFAEEWGIPMMTEDSA